MGKIFVLDTSVFSTSATALFAFEEHTVVILSSVLEELQKKAARPGECGENAREVIRTLEILRAKGDLLKGVPLGQGTLVVVVPKAEQLHSKVDYSDSVVSECAAVYEKVQSYFLTHPTKAAEDDSAKQTLFAFVTNSFIRRIKADAAHIPTETFRADKMADIKAQYSGRCVLNATSADISTFMEKNYIPVDVVCQKKLNENQFVRLVDICDDKHSVLGWVKGHNIVPLRSLKKRPSNIAPQNEGQRYAQEALYASVDDIPLVILKGPAGTAKTMYSLAVGLEQTQDGIYDRILVTRPNVKFDEDIGFLKGTEEEKIGPLVRPIFDNLEFLLQNSNRDCRKAEQLFADGVIAAQAMAYMRGRSIHNTWLIVDEAQNMTPLQAFGIISRCGKGTKVIFTGDPEQIDNPMLDSRTNGLTYASEKMKNSALCAQVCFSEQECVRSPLAQEAIRMFTDSKEENDV